MSIFVTNGTDLTQVANAIREKSNSSLPLRFPDGFADTVRAIPTLPAGMHIKYIIPVTLTMPRTADEMGFDVFSFTFTRENVNQMFNIDFLLQDATDYADGYWVQHIQFNMCYQGNYEGQHNVYYAICGAGKRGNLTPTSKVSNYGKNDLTGNLSFGTMVGSSAGYQRLGKNYKGIIIITDSSYNGAPMVDADKFSQFFTCHHMQAGW